VSGRKGPLNAFHPGIFGGLCGWRITGFGKDSTFLARVNEFALGFAICKPIVEARGGSIEVASQPSEGTKFTVRLKVSRAKIQTQRRKARKGDFHGKQTR